MAAHIIDSVKGAWNSGTSYDGGNMGHRPGVKGGYFPVPPVDRFQDLRSAMCQACEDGAHGRGAPPRGGTAGQGEIGVGPAT